MDKLKVFEKHLELIKTNPIRGFTEFCIDKMPEYFFSLPASTGGTHHGAGETLIDHVQGCLWLAEKVFEQLEKVWTQRQKDQLISSIILHDGWRCHKTDGTIRVYTQEDIDAKGLSNDLLGKFRSTSEHPESAFWNLLKLSVDFNKWATENKKNLIGAKDLNAILSAIRLHCGPWSENKDKPFSLDWPYSNLTMVLHNIDYFQTLSAEYWTKEKK